MLHVFNINFVINITLLILISGKVNEYVENGNGAEGFDL